MTLSVRLLPLGRETYKPLTLIFNPVVQKWLNVRLVLTKVVTLFVSRVLVTVRTVSAAPLDDLGLQTLTTCFPGQLFILSVVPKVTELAGTILILRMRLLFTPTTEFPLKSPLTPLTVVRRVPSPLSPPGPGVPLTLFLNLNLLPPVTNHRKTREVRLPAPILPGETTCLTTFLLPTTKAAWKAFTHPCLHTSPLFYILKALISPRLALVTSANGSRPPLTNPRRDPLLPTSMLTILQFVRPSLVQPL